MPLEEYRQKRDFDRTPEPPGDQPGETRGALRFVVQKHRASRLHYDFRLELDGVLLSWAIPKGPSLDPQDKRFAVKVEDHPLEYRNFEGVIEPGNYGAGAVILWDEGTYQASGARDREESERRMRIGLQRGELKFVLHGKKLQGEYALVRLKSGQEDGWLLIKKKDDAASQEDVLEQDRSVRSGRTLAEVAAAASSASQDASAGNGRQGEKPATHIESRELRDLILGGARRAPMPADVQPMLATLTDEPFDSPQWIYELKWDGFRAIAETRPPQARLYSRTKQDFEREFSPLVRELEKIPFEAVLDGEIVVIDDEGRAEFRLLQRYRRTGEGLLVYYVFDLLYLDGYDLQRLPLERRKEILRQALPRLPRIKYSDHVEEHGVDLYRLALENGLEGIIAKDKASPYRQGVRGVEWLKFKTHLRQEAVIGGFTQPRGSRENLGALLLGVYQGKNLVYVGHTGGGFTAADLAEMRARLDPLVRKTSPFATPPKTNTPATWVEPELVCEVRFADWTNDGRMRMPVFMGLREDIRPEQVRREIPVDPARALERKKIVAKSERKETWEIGGHSVTVSNLKKVYWPDDAITKGDMLAYYREIASYILPYLKDRPENLHRFPNGIKGKRFYQKDVDEVPEWAQTVTLESENQEGSVDYLVCQNEATLLYMANLGAIEINPWNSRIGSLDNPDYLVIDLDPEGRPFADVVQVALAFHEVLEKIQATNLIKTSGQTGLHIFVPLGAQYSYEQTRQFAHLLGKLVHQAVPELTSLERSPKKRKGKVYLDYLQNAWGQTMVAPYSLRPKPEAPVSTPLRWDEVRPGLDPKDFTIKNIAKRVEKVGDLWVGVLGPGINMQGSLQLLEASWQELQEAID